jgi:hypothetical protein
MNRDDDDIEFDFFAEPETREAQPSERGVRESPPKRGGPPRRPVPATPLLRLLGLVGFAILIVVLLVLWVSSCGGTSKVTTYRNYMAKASIIGSGSQKVGKQLLAALNTAGIKSAELDPKIRNLAQQEQQRVVSAQAIVPPKAFADVHARLLEALQLRVSGLQGIAAVFRTSAAVKDNAETAGKLAVQSQRLVAADVVWADLFKSAADVELQLLGVAGITVPASDLLAGNDLGSSATWAPILQRIQGAATGGGTAAAGLHGMGLFAVKVLPAGTLLSASIETTIIAKTDLGFEVTVEDTGANQEVQVNVTLTIRQSPVSIVKKAVIDQINPGEQKTVIFDNLGPVQFAKKTSVKVDVTPVPGEKSTTNNSAEYPVIFSLG